MNGFSIIAFHVSDGADALRHGSGHLRGVSEAGVRNDGYGGQVSVLLLWLF